MGREEAERELVHVGALVLFVLARGLVGGHGAVLQLKPLAVGLEGLRVDIGGLLAPLPPAAPTEPAQR